MDNNKDVEKSTQKDNINSSVGYNYPQDRKTGRSTRLIDSYVQAIFKHPEAMHIILDHSNGNASYKLNKILFDKVLRRLNIEHNIYPESIVTKGSTTVRLIVNPKELTMQLKVWIEQEEN